MAQIAATLGIPKKQHLTGEPVIAVVTLTNHSGRDLVFQSDGRFQWLNFIVRKNNGNTVNGRNAALFGPMKIRAGQTLAREVDLSRHFQLAEPGNFSVTAVIRQPGASSAEASTNRAFFNQAPGRVYWSRKAGIPGAGATTRDFRVIHFSGDSKSQLYAQIADDMSGQLVRTFLLGDVLMMRKPLVTMDRQQRMHVLFLVTPAMWVHCVIDADGRLVNRQIHQRGPYGDPQLMAMGDGSVNVANSIPYDPKQAAEQRAKTRKASDRPAITY
jgi:hypothetical protein